MQKKVKFNSFIKPLHKLTREPSLKMLATDKDINKKRNISIDFSISPFKSQKKIIKRNCRKNSFTNIILNQTESTFKTKINNLSYLPSRKLLTKHIPSLKNKNNLFPKKKIITKNKTNKSFNDNSIKKNVMINTNQINSSLIKKNTKNIVLNTQPTFQETKNKNKQKKFGSINDNYVNNYNNSFALKKQKFQ